MKLTPEQISKLESEVSKVMAPEAAKQDERRASFKTWLDSFPKVDGLMDMKSEDLSEFHRRNDELDATEKVFEQKREVVIADVKNRILLDGMNAPRRDGFPGLSYATGKDGQPAAPSAEYAEARREAMKTLGQRFVESEAFLAFNPNARQPLSTVIKGGGERSKSVV